MLERLTETERGVTEGVAAARTAARLDLSHETVTWTLTKIYRELGTPMRTQLSLPIRDSPAAQGRRRGERRR